jgi:hypothetical protein
MFDSSLWPPVVRAVVTLLSHKINAEFSLHIQGLSEKSVLGVSYTQQNNT